MTLDSKTDGAVLENKNTVVRDSGIELFRIVVMIIIVAHHYFVNSGISKSINVDTIWQANSIFLILLGWGGKTAINCFVLITGYFMCKSKITLRKFLKLLFVVQFYRIIEYVIFIISGYQTLNVQGVVNAIFPVTSISREFISCFFVFYLFIPFLNLLIGAMNKKQHFTLIWLCVSIYTIVANLLFHVEFNYSIWFCVLYLIASYIRLYPSKWSDSKKMWGFLSLLSVILSWLSVVLIALLMSKIKVKLTYYNFVADSNAIFALSTAVCSFMFFKNLKIGYSKIINTIAASSFGVLLIHDNGRIMRQWLWTDTLKCPVMFNSPYLYVHAFLSIAGVYIICTVIDILRIKFVEKPLFKFLDKKVLK